MKSFSKWLKKYFIPHEVNQFKPHFLRHESILFFFSLIIILELGFLIQAFNVFDKASFLAEVLPAVLTDLTNKDRIQNNAPLLVQNILLTKAAQLKAEDMATHQYFAHTSPDGKTPWYWFEHVGYNFSAAGENLAVNFFESSDVAKAWMDSPTHRANIVKKEYKEIGIGVASGIYQGKNTVFVAQLFGTPIAIASTPTQTEVITETEKVVTTQTPEIQPENVETQVVPVQVITTEVATTSETQVLGEETAPKLTTSTPTISTSVKMAIGRILASPREYVNSIYVSIAVLFMFALILTGFIKSEMAHPAMLTKGLGLVLVIIVLLVINIKILNVKPNIGATDLGANAINTIEYQILH